MAGVLLFGLVYAVKEGFSAPGGAPCDTKEDCNSGFCHQVNGEGPKICAEEEQQISSA